MVKKRNHMPPPSQSVAEAEQILAALEGKKTKLEAFGEKLTLQRKTRALKAFTAEGDSVLKRELEQVVTAIAINDQMLASVGEAIAEASSRVAVARALELETAGRAKAQQISELAAAFREAGNEMGRAADTLSESSRLLINLMTQLHGLGVSHPTNEQLDILGHQAILTMLGGTAWAKHYPMLAPHERRSFADLISGWATMIEARVRSQLGESKEEIAA